MTEPDNKSDAPGRQKQARPTAPSQLLLNMFTFGGLLTFLAALSVLLGLAWLADPDSFRPEIRSVPIGVSVYCAAAAAFFYGYLRVARKRSEVAEADIARSQDALSRFGGAGQPAWELALQTQDQYWQRNSAQNWLIFAASVLAISAGFFVMVYGAFNGIASRTNIQAAALATAAGALTQFVGATFLFIYRSTMQQMTTFNTTLERINSVGMAWYLVQTITEDSAEDISLKNRIKGMIALSVIGQQPIIDFNLKAEEKPTNDATPTLDRGGSA